MERDTSHLDRITELCSEASIAATDGVVNPDFRAAIEAEVWADFADRIGTEAWQITEDQATTEFDTWRRQFFGE